MEEYIPKLHIHQQYDDMQNVGAIMVVVYLDMQVFLLLAQPPFNNNICRFNQQYTRMSYE